MHWILILGAALNWFGALSGLQTASRELSRVEGPGDYWLLRLFFLGTAATFGSLYLYLFFNPQYVWPFLIFGAALKSWAFLIALYLYRVGKLSREGLAQFGVSNGVVAIGFWVYLFSL
jgi:hypothetical protein